MDIVERIKQKCKENSSNIATLEKELHIGNGVIRRWNERNPGAEQVYKVAICLNTTVEWLLTGKEAPDLTPEEQELVECYRAASEPGKKSIMAQARFQQQEQSSSASRIG